jgi:hypothetical protein
LWEPWWEQFVSSPFYLQTQQLNKEKRDEKNPGDPGSSSFSHGLDSAGCEYVDRNLEVQRREVKVQPWTALQEPDGEGGSSRRIKSDRGWRVRRWLSYRYSCAANFDGKDNPVTGSPMIDTIAYTKIDDNTFEGTSKKAGKVVSNVKIVVAKDGKTMTVTVKGKNAKGEAVSDVIAYDRQ